MFEVMEYNFYGDELDIRVISEPLSFDEAFSKAEQMEHSRKPGVETRYYIRHVSNEGKK